MVTDELVSLIKDKFLQGQRRYEIREGLLNEGYEEDDIDEAISKIQNDAIKHLPGISWIYKHVEHFESKPNSTSPKTTIFFMIGCIVFLFVLAGALYLFFDPLGTGSNARDIKRQADQTVIQNALTEYYQKDHDYPNALGNLVPGFIPSIPNDPQTGAAYYYKEMANNSNYELCITFETQQKACVNAISSSNGIPIVPTETPVPTFIPQTASVTPVKSLAN
jgi:hypothetical protein